MKILQVTSSILGDHSFSTKLGNAIVEKLKAKESGSTVLVKDLGMNPLHHFSTAFFVPAENRTPEQDDIVASSDEAIKEVNDADAIVISIPMYNFSFPSNLKTWIDNICRAGITFHYTETGPEGLINGKKVYLAISTGGIYTVEETRPLDFTEPYVKTVLGFIGMTDVTVFRVEGVALSEIKEKALADAIKAVDEAPF